MLLEITLLSSSGRRTFVLLSALFDCDCDVLVAVVAGVFVDTEGLLVFADGLLVVLHSII